MRWDGNVHFQRELGLKTGTFVLTEACPRHRGSLFLLIFEKEMKEYGGLDSSGTSFCGLWSGSAESTGFPLQTDQESLVFQTVCVLPGGHFVQRRASLSSRQKCLPGRPDFFNPGNAFLQTKDIDAWLKRRISRWTLGPRVGE